MGDNNPIRGFYLSCMVSWCNFVVSVVLLKLIFEIPPLRFSTRVVNNSSRIILSRLYAMELSIKSEPSRIAQMMNLSGIY